MFRLSEEAGEKSYYKKIKKRLYLHEIKILVYSGHTGNMLLV